MYVYAGPVKALVAVAVPRVSREAVAVPSVSREAVAVVSSKVFLTLEKLVSNSSKTICRLAP